MFKRIVIALALCSATLVAQAPGFSPFSADMKMESAKGAAASASGKMYFDGGNMRMEMSQQGHDVAMITNTKSQTTYMVMPQQHMYMEIHPGQGMMGRNIPSIKPPSDPNNPCANQPGTTCTKVGTETVNGRVCDKWEFTNKDGHHSTAWVDQKLHFPIKTVGEDGSRFELSNVQEGSQPASLFQPPAGFRKMDMGGMMGGMGAQGGPPR